MYERFISSSMLTGCWWAAKSVIGVCECLVLSAWCLVLVRVLRAWCYVL
jgi:hypothetical protein